MNLDERLESIGQRLGALTMNLELTARQTEDNRQAMAESRAEFEHRMKILGDKIVFLASIMDESRKAEDHRHAELDRRQEEVDRRHADMDHRLSLMMTAVSQLATVAGDHNTRITKIERQVA